MHRWSGWPGAYCLDCGIEDPFEIAMAEGNYIEVDPENKGVGHHYEFPNVHLTPCPCPGSNNHNPYEDKVTYQRRRFKKEMEKIEEILTGAKPIQRRRRLPFGECPSCDRDGPEGPSHDPSPLCESGSRPHCTCDLCF